MVKVSYVDATAYTVCAPLNPFNSTSRGSLNVPAPTRLSTSWRSEWNAGNLARYDPTDGSWRAWPLPGDAPQT